MAILIFSLSCTRRQTHLLKSGPRRERVPWSICKPVLMGFLSILCSCWKKAFEPAQTSISNDLAEVKVHYFDLQTLQVATNFFSQLNKLGNGGFGSVYKGLMPNGEEVAVKKFSVTSSQGAREFINEAKMLSRIQHKNIVNLLGCCVEGPERILVSEYMPSKSLDFFLFDKTMSSLDWTTRFQIVKGVATGLSYLQEERIIHTNIKASNIFLDEHSNPKIKGFGLARLFPREDTHVNTYRICGTYGYMAPEYAMHGYLSEKTDVFSYGVVVLEIVSGRKNHDSQLGTEKEDLLRYAWMLYQKGKTLELVDPNLAKCKSDEAEFCIQLGLLCCQQCIADRPDMNSVHLSLSGNSLTLPRPIQGCEGLWSTTSIEDYSWNSISVSSIDEGR